MDVKYMITSAQKFIDNVDIGFAIDDPDAFEAQYNARHKKSPIEVCFGCARGAIVFARRDYVIKFMYIRTEDDPEFSSERDEEQYSRAVRLGVSDFFVPAFRLNHPKYFIQVMEKINAAVNYKIFDSFHNYKEIDEDVRNKIFDFVGDDHNENWGFDKLGHPRIFDYTM